jgi:TIR domain
MQQKPQQRISVLCVAAPYAYDQSLLSLWEKHLLPLEQAGHLTIWSERHLAGGESRQEQIDIHLTQAKLIILLLSPDFFASKECISLMEQALQRHDSDQTHVVPLLLRPVAWRESPIGTLTCLPTNNKPVILWSSRDAAFHNSAEAICSLLDLPMAATSASDQAQTSTVQQGLPLPIPRLSPSKPRWQALWHWNYPRYPLSPLVPTRPQSVSFMFSRSRYYPKMMLYGFVILTLLFFAAMTFVSMRSSWCPSLLCPLRPTPPNTAFNDGNLTVALANQPQTPFYVYLSPQQPADSLSTQIGATYAEGMVTLNRYHIMLGLQNLRKDTGLTIESVDLLMTKILVLPSHPLKVWANPNQFMNASHNYYIGQYDGQLAGEQIPMTYDRFQDGLGYVHLDPLETDQIDVQVISRREVNMRFRILITYRIDDRPDLPTLLFPQTFQVAFAVADDWHLCKIEMLNCS